MTNDDVSPAGDFADLIGALYATWSLDGLIELAFAVSLDFVARPQMYVDADIPDSIADLRVAYGTDRNFQNTAERQALLLPILGRSDWLKPDAGAASSSFYLARKKLFEACTAFSERAVDTGIAALEQRVRSALVTFQTTFQSLNGRSVRLAAKLLGKTSENAIRILRARGVAKVFGQDAPDEGWPFAPGTFISTSDASGAKLVDAAGVLPGVATEYRLSSTRFALLQKVAQEGGSALPVVLNTDPANAGSDALEDLIARSYSWATSLYNYQHGS